jgi:hypothetical protein
MEEGVEMFQHPEVMRFLVTEHVNELRRAARPIVRTSRPVVNDLADVELRLCRIGDDPALEQLAALAERALPFGRSVVALVNGRLVAALPLAGGHMITDPFVRTTHLRPLLELRAAQLREPERRRRLLPRSLNLIRGSTHA